MEYYFITGSGRSGTNWLSKVLNEITEDTVKHEYIGKKREYWLLSHFLPGEAYAIPYLIEYKRQIEEHFDAPGFIDVNSFLQNSIPALREVFETKNVLGLVRDGRDVVRSFYRRRPSDDVPIFCDINRSAVEEWIRADKFEKICYHWVRANEKLVSNQVEIIHLEKLISDYRYFIDRLATPLGITLEETSWKALVSKRINETRSSWYRRFYSMTRRKPVVTDNLPHWSAWGASEKSRFSSICGPMMETLGYDISSW